MATFLVTLVVFSLAVLGLGVGYLVQGRELKGSCGGLAAMNDEPCPVCGGSPSACDADGDTPAPGTSDGEVRRYRPAR